MERTEIRSYLDNTAKSWDHLEAKNPYYRDWILRIVSGMTVHGSHILEIGAGTGNLLHALRPSRGVGINYSDSLTQIARKKHPNLEFISCDIDEVTIPRGFNPDVVILNNSLELIHDLWDFSNSLANKIGPECLVIIITNNPLWAPILRLSGRLNLKFPEHRRNFYTNKDITNVLRLNGFDLVHERIVLPFPKNIPLISPFMNLLLPELPLFNFLGSLQIIAARPKRTRNKLSCSVVIPCHNEEGNIEDTVKRVPNMGTKTEIIIVDDGSKDHTLDAANRLLREDARVRIVKFSRNKGKAAAVFAGCDAATGDVVMILDADATVDPEALPKFFAPIQDGSTDFINGTRLIYQFQNQAMRFANYIGNKLFCFLVSYILHQRVSDTLCGTKALLRRDWLAIHRGTDRWGDFDLIFGAARLCLRISEVPIHYRARVAGVSKMRSAVEVWRFLWACGQGWIKLRVPTRLKRREPRFIFSRKRKLTRG